MVTILTQRNSIANHYIAELRNVHVQNDRMRFRKNIERIGETIAYKISETLTYLPQQIETPLGIANTNLIDDQPVIISIMRAGLPFHQGFLNIFDQADSGFIAAYRHTKKSGEFEIHKKYESVPNLDTKIVIIVDPMLATGKSLAMCCQDLLINYNIKELHVAAIIASEEGLSYVKEALPEAIIWIGDLDKELTNKAYIVPGLGDAGDLAYGKKY
ncbi:uracil phosphoribosyltransferase [Sphingobacterium rhinopitheci]|uniref:uracil phosphoribosyltransferase n=1 Tax=Sphingobacterium rhinopitheci TaxID=2781960 RepID=UPI001F528102|nr:uracil phosphoribosyltransferase [Sphingobacterium rhinopitheci]MCI0920198.1 uracil phosphoribosyltransferase [Sphingobacterium rhinopitheci]